MDFRGIDVRWVVGVELVAEVLLVVLLGKVVGWHDAHIDARVDFG